MGLDMYAYTISKEIADKYQDTDPSFTDEFRESINWNFAYWRKFKALHGWMEDLYRKKGGTDPYFNCNIVRLKQEDIDALEETAKNKKLEGRAGFFFGSTEVDKDDYEAIHDFVKKCREAFNEGLAVYYDSWW